MACSSSISMIHSDMKNLSIGSQNDSRDTTTTTNNNNNNVDCSSSCSSGVVVVVDPYSSGRFLVDELQERGETIIAIRSNLDMVSSVLAGFKPEKYHAYFDVVPTEMDPRDVGAHVEKNWGKPKAIFAGSEPGVILCDHLRTYFNMPGNDSATSECRRNKAVQQDRLRACGVRAIKQLYSDNLDEIIAWRKENLTFPVVVKPALSAGTDGVYFCNSDQQILDAYNANMGHTDILGNKTDKVLIQEFLQGLEYVVDCVSRDGDHVLAAIWVYKKHANVEKGCITYDYTESLPATGEVQEQLIEYMMGKGGVLDSLGIRYGPSHAEIMMTPTGPCLVECANRMHGCDGPETGMLCTGVGQHQLNADAVLGGGLFEKCLAQKRYTVLKKSICLTLFNEDKSGPIAKDVDCPELREVCKRSLREVCALKKGDMLVPTRDLMTTPGDVLLLHSDESVLWEDVAAIRKLEATGDLYPIDEALKSDHEKAETSSTSEGGNTTEEEEQTSIPNSPIKIVEIEQQQQ